jgi:uncharacterized repeat protein (TIGR01451 family)/LPXTG-motif cell wall-anchored protein
MKRHVSLARSLRLVLAAALATPVAITLATSSASPVQAALGGVTPFEIDSNTVVTTVGNTDWVSKAAAGDVAVSNDSNFTGAAVVQSDVGSSSTAPSWLANCPSSNSDSVFKNSTNIADPDWTGDHSTQSVPGKEDICQSYFSSDVIQSGLRAGHIISYVAFTRRVFNGDGSYYFLLSKGPNPDIRVAGDIVIEVDYGSQGQAQGLTIQNWTGAGTPTLSAPTPIAVNNPNVELSPVQYFAEIALDLTALGLAPNVYDLPTPESCLAFGFGRVISRTGNSASATLKDDGEPAGLDFNVCGKLIVKKQLTSSVPGTTDFPVDVTAPSGVTLPYPHPVLRVPGGTTSGGTAVDGNANPAPNATPTGNPITYQVLPPRQTGGYNVWEPLAGDLGVRWHRDSIVCVNDKGTAATGDDVTTTITSPSNLFSLFTLETVTCTITNSPAPAVINVDKNAGGNPGSWPVNLTGAGSGSVTVTDDGTIDFTTGGTFKTFGNRAAGSYTLTEGAETGGGAFRPTGWSCTVVGGATTTASGASIGVNANPGDVVNCTITNTPVAPPNVEVTKSAAPTSFPETAPGVGSTVVYTVDIRNAGTEPFTITNITDALDGGSSFDLDAAVANDSAGLPGATIVANDCGGLIGDSVLGGATATCHFSVSYTGQNAGAVIHDTVNGFVIDSFNRTDSDDDDATVTVTDVPPVITVDKQNVPVNNSTAVVAPGGPATYSIKITNGPNAIEAITLTAVTDTLTSPAGFNGTSINYFTVGGAVTATDCINFVGKVLGIGESVSCTFTIDTTLVGSLVKNDVLTNRVDVTAEDNDGTEVSGFDTASRTVLAEPPALNVFKTDNGAQIDEPGDDIAYDVTLTNLSVTEPLTITSIVDDVFYTPLGDPQVSAGTLVIDELGVDDSGLTGATFVSTDCDTLIGTVLAVNGTPGDEATCTITLHLEGNAGDSFHDIVTGNAVTNDGTPASAENEADTPVVDVLPAIGIVKDVAPGHVAETGGDVTYTLTITNNSGSSDPLTITHLSDSVFGTFFPNPDLHGATDVDCGALEGDTVLPGDSVSCTFTATISGEAGETHENTASVTGEDDEGNPASDSDDASVLFDDVKPVIVVTKTANPTTVPESGGLVTFTVTIENATLEPVVTTSLVDDVYGNLVGRSGSTCVVGGQLAAADGVVGSGPDFYQCTFQVNVAQVAAELAHHDTVTAKAVDNEQNQATASDDAIVTFDLIPPTVDISKTDGDATVNEPGGNVKYTIGIKNTSFEPVTVTTLTDTITYEIPAGNTVVDLLHPVAPVSAFECHDGLDTPIDISTYSLAPGQTVTCSFVVALAGTAQIVRDVVNVVVVDNDGQTGDDHANEATPIKDVRPAIGITKTADPITINTGDSVHYTFVISNLSDAEPLTLLTLNDDKFGDIFAECGLTGVVLAANNHAPGGPDEKTCEINRTITQAPGTTHTNVVTVTGADDETLANLAKPIPDRDPLLVPVSATAQASVLVLTPNTTVVKTVHGTPTRDAATGVWTIQYDVIAANGGPGRAIVDVNDTLKFGAGVVFHVDSVTTTPGVTPNPDFDGTTHTLLAGQVVLNSQESRTFTITVKATIPTPVAGEGSCDSQGVENGGFLNTVRLTSATDGKVSTSLACAPFSTLTLVKQLTTDGDPGTVKPTDFTLSASAGQVTQMSGAGHVTAALPPATYQLAESSVPGYSAVAPGFVCSNENTGSSVTLSAGADVTCTITNDLESTIKISALAPECIKDVPFIQYAITPSGFTPTGGATLDFFDKDGKFVESVSVASLSGTVIYPGATADADGNGTDWPGWKFENGVWVVDPTDAHLRDGLTVVAHVNPTSPPAEVTYPPATSVCANPQQVAADMAIVKSASVPQVGAGGAFTWLLDVTNNGPDTATNVSISDIVPSQVVVTGVSSSDFTCSNSGNTVTCTKASMAVGATGHIAAAVTVPTAAADGNVTNIGSVTASQPDPDPSNNSDDASVTIVAQAPPPPTPPPVVLPPTGSNSTQPVTWAAISLMLIGGVVLLVSRRRRDHTPID